MRTRQPALHVVWRPGETRVNPQGYFDNVYSTWAGAYGAIQRVRNKGQVILEVDDTMGACTMPSSAAEPGGVWDLTNVRLTCFTKGSSPGYTATILTLADGCKWYLDPAKGKVMRIDGENFNIVCNRTGPVIPIENIDLLLCGNRVRLCNTSAQALPMVARASGVGALNFVACSGNNAYGGIGDQVRCPAPVIDIRGGTFLFGGAHGFASDNAFTDSVGGGTLVFRMMSDAFTGGSYADQTYDYPGMAGATINFSVESRDRHKVSAVVTTTPYNATFNELVRVDSTGGVRTVNAPKANPAKGERLVVKDTGGAAGTNAITIAPQAGESIEAGSITTNGQCKTWVADGAGNWMLVAIST